MRTLRILLLAAAVALAAPTATSAQSLDTENPLLPTDATGGTQTGAPGEPGSELPDHEEEVNRLTNQLPGSEKGSNPAPGRGGDLGDIGKNVAAAVADDWMLTGIVAVSLAGVGLFVFFFVNRYMDPRKALENPHRSMLYGFVKGNPGVHLKQLSSEFDMKTSTVLWHIRKLECADLVRSKKANGYRVFYPVSGGMEARQLSTAITALSNENARRIFEYLAIKPGAQQRELSEKLAINSGTVRWHLKKLRAAGLAAELIKERAGFYYATELGIKAMRQVAGLPPDIRAPTIDVAEVDASLAA